MPGTTPARFAVLLAVCAAACSDRDFSTVAATRTPALVADATRPAMGWNSFDVLSTNRPGYGSSWLNEAHIKQSSDVMAQKFQSAGYTYINIDSGWSNGVDGNGVPVPDLGRFPSGISGVADYVHANGQKLGIYGVIGLPADIYGANYPIAGTSCHTKDIALQPLKLSPNGWNWQYEIDWSNPCAQAYYNSIANRFASWGIDLLKIDGTTVDNGPDIVAWQTALAQTGRPIWLTVSAWPVPLALGPTIRNAGQGVRVDTDIDCYCSTISGWTTSVNQRWNDLPSWLPFVGPGHFPDLDSMPISNNSGNGVQDGINDLERQSVMTFWSMASSPLWVGGDIYFMDQKAQEIVTNPEVIAVDQAGVMPTQIAAGNAQVWRKALPDGTTAVAVYNLGGSTTSITVDFAAIGLGGDASVRDLVGRVELGVFTGNWTASNVPAHGSRLIKLTAQNDGIAGYTFCASEYANCTLSGTMDVAYGAQGSYVYRSGLGGAFACGNGTFGSDPAYGSTKGCYVRAHGGGGPGGFTYCAGEGQSCAPSGVVDVAYGAVGSFAYKTGVVGGFGCNVTWSGSDPAYGWQKACYTRPSGGGVAYEAEAATLAGAAAVAGCAGCSGGKKVGFVGGNGGNRVVFPQVDAATSGDHVLTIHAASADPRTVYVSVNGGAGVPVAIQSSGWATPAIATVTVTLGRGNNTIALYNDGQWAPDIDRIVVW
jgi:hypothetical protein